MKIIFIVIVSVLIIGSISSVGYLLLKEKTTPVAPQGESNEIADSAKLVDFSKVNSEFLFSAKIPKEFEVEYIPNLKALNVYDPRKPGSSNIEKSQIYITFFKANTFLTLNTVEITQRDKVSINGKDATLYEITKKGMVPNFAGQPSWRNATHKAIDIRASQDSPSYFYSFAKNPNLSREIFDEFIDSLIFY